jgi:hypothetical protein
MVQAYRLLKDSSIRSDVKAGDIVYCASVYDYGLASDDTHATGVEHISVSLRRNGGYPTFTAPCQDLGPCDAPTLPPLTKEHMDFVCRPGQGAGTCRYLTTSAKGFGCEKHTELADYLDERVRTNSMTAQGDNCEGREGNC